MASALRAQTRPRVAQGRGVLVGQSLALLLELGPGVGQGLLHHAFPGPIGVRTRLGHGVVERPVVFIPQP